jgi:PAS domain S-box-containing protein
MSVASFPTPAAVPVRVLLLEDTDLDAYTFEEVLRHSGFAVNRVSRLSEAIAALPSEELDVILCDLGLPDSAGMETLESLLQRTAVPIVVITGHGDDETAQRAVAAGAQDYLVKGTADANALVRALRYAVKRGRANGETSSIESHTRAILEGALDAVVSIGHDGRITRWNRSAEEIFGWQRAEVLGRRLDEVIVPERFREQHRRGLTHFAETGDAPLLGKRVEWTALRKDGSEFPVEVRITAEAGPTGMTFTAFVADITERRRAEDERRASEAKFRALVEHTSDVIFLYGADGTFTYASPAVTRMLGYQPSELLGRHPDDFIHPDDVAYLAQRFSTPPAGNAIPVLAEFRFRHRNGSWRHLEVLRANRLSDPAVHAIVGNVRDVTGRRQAQQALDTLRRRYELILNSITDGVHGVDLAGNVVFENPAGSAMLGWRPAELIGCPAHQTVHHSRADGSPRPESECPMHWTLADGTVRFSEDDVFWRKDGTALRVAYTAAPMVDEQGRIAGAVVTFRDISKQKQMEQQIEQGLRVASLGRVSASVAHEFNNLLMSIAPSAEVLRRKSGDPALEKPVKHVLDAVRRGQRLTDEILRFTNPPEPRIQRIDLAAAGREFCDEARGILAERRVEIELSAELEVRADVDQLSQVMLNLVTNARNATQPGGKVTIGAAPAASIAFLRTQLPDAERFVALYVRDDGCGISAEAKERIFEPFFTTRKASGTGLGLAVAYRIVAQHGGHILIESEVGRGATFYVALPQ